MPLCCPMTFPDAPLLISLIAAGYLAVIYLLLTLAQRTRKLPRL